jgi:hypothetical protein
MRLAYCCTAWLNELGCLGPSAASPQRFRNVTGLVAFLLAMLACCPHPAAGQAAWEFSPYQVRVRLAVAARPQLPAPLIETLSRQILDRADAAQGAVWTAEVLPAEPALRDLTLLRLNELSPDDVVAAAPDDQSADKLYLVALDQVDGVYSVRSREFDCRTRHLGPVHSRQAASSQALPLAAWDCLASAFTPLVRIEDVEDSRVLARVRAGGLIVDPASTALIHPGMVLRPTVRRNDRSGKPLKGGIQPLPWTLLTVTERRDSLLDCELLSGFRAPIPTRGGLRTERLALLVKPIWERTRLVLEARSTPGKPLVGYEVHMKTPGSDDSQLIAATDLFGAIELPREQGQLRLLYVKNGRQLLARLPIVFGQERETIVPLVDDDGRLQAEGFVMALSARALDLVARREIAAGRIRAYLKEGKLTEAQQLLEEFRQLETRGDLSRALDAQQQQLASPDKTTQARIDRLLADARKLLLNKALSDSMLNDLTREVASGRVSQQASAK